MVFCHFSCFPRSSAPVAGFTALGSLPTQGPQVTQHHFWTIPLPIWLTGSAPRRPSLVQCVVMSLGIIAQCVVVSLGIVVDELLISNPSYKKSFKLIKSDFSRSTMWTNCHERSDSVSMQATVQMACDVWGLRCCEYPWLISFAEDWVSSNKQTNKQDNQYGLINTRCFSRALNDSGVSTCWSILSLQSWCEAWGRRGLDR